MKFVARWYQQQTENDETVFVYKEHDPHRYDVASLLWPVHLAYDRDSETFRLDASSVEALNEAVLQHDHQDAELSGGVSTSRAQQKEIKKPTTRKRSGASKRCKRHAAEQELSDGDGEDDNGDDVDDDSDDSDNDNAGGDAETNVNEQRRAQTETRQQRAERRQRLRDTQD